MAIRDCSAQPGNERFVYQLRRDALDLVARMNAGQTGPIELDSVKKQLLFFQTKLIEGAMADPGVPTQYRPAMLRLQDYTLQECVSDRRGEKRRSLSLIEIEPRLRA